jgi:hypothetical protein
MNDFTRLCVHKIGDICMFGRILQIRIVIRPVRHQARITGLTFDMGHPSWLLISPA